MGVEVGWGWGEWLDMLSTMLGKYFVGSYLENNEHKTGLTEWL
jgi:hypothetical protein